MSDDHYDDDDYDDGGYDDGYGGGEDAYHSYQADECNGGSGESYANEYQTEDPSASEYYNEPTDTGDAYTANEYASTTDKDTSTQYTPDDSATRTNNYDEPYTVTASGENEQVRTWPSCKALLSVSIAQLMLNAQGNHWCNRDYGADAPDQNSYHYSNTDGSYYYSNPDGKGFRTMPGKKRADRESRLYLLQRRPGREQVHATREGGLSRLLSFEVGSESRESRYIIVGG